MMIVRVIILLWMLGSYTAGNAADLSAEQHYANGLLLLSENDGSGEASMTQAGLLAAINKLEKALAMGITPNKEVRLVLSRAYYICMITEDSTKERPNDKEKHAMECRKKGDVLIKHLNEEFPNDPRVLKQFAKSSVFNKDLQLSIFENLLKVSSKDASVHGELASLYLGKGKDKEAIAQYREAIMLELNPHMVTYYMDDVDAAFRALGCPLDGLKELSRKVEFTNPPLTGAEPLTKEKFSVEFTQLKKQIIVKIDNHKCEKLK